MSRNRRPFALAVVIGSGALTAACSVVLTWDDYAGARNGVLADAGLDDEAQPPSDADRDPDADTNDAGMDAKPDVEPLAAIDVLCNPLVCRNGDKCCVFGDGGRDCRPSCGVGASIVLECDSAGDCSGNSKCCAELSDAGDLAHIQCRTACASPLRACDPANADVGCGGNATCSRRFPASGLALVLCLPN